MDRQPYFRQNHSLHLLIWIGSDLLYCYGNLNQEGRKIMKSNIFHFMNTIIMNLPFNYLLINGNIFIDEYKMTLGSRTYGKSQLIKRNIKDERMNFHYYNPEDYSKNHEELRFYIGGGMMSIWNDSTSSFGDILIIRTNLHTTMSQSFVLYDDTKEKLGRNNVSYSV